MQVGGARQPLGGVVVLAPPLAVEGLEGGAKVLVEFRSDLVVAQELPAHGGRLSRGLGGPEPPRVGRSSIRGRRVLLLG